MPEIRPVLESDVPAIHAIEEATFAMPWSAESVLHDIRDNVVARWLVMEEEGELLGYAGVWFVLDEGHVMNIAIRERDRGRGLGRKLVDALIALCRANGMRLMTLEVRRSNLVAQSLYHACGFHDVGYRKRYYEDNHEDALIMYLDLV